MVRLDPFGVVGGDDHFNPLDLVSGGPHQDVIDVFQFAELLIKSSTPPTDPLWYNSALGLARAVLQYLLSLGDKPRTIGELWKTFHQKDFIKGFAVVLDNHAKELPFECYREISVFLQRDENLRSRILANVTQALAAFGLPSVQRLVSRTSFDLDAVSRGEAAVFIQIPAASWRSHGGVARLWLSSLLHLAASRGGEGPALAVVADGAASLRCSAVALGAAVAGGVGGGVVLLGHPGSTAGGLAGGLVGVRGRLPVGASVGTAAAAVCVGAGVGLRRAGGRPGAVGGG